MTISERIPMLRFVNLLLPPLVLICFRSFLLHKRYKLHEYLLQYLFAMVLMITFLLDLIGRLLHNSGDLFLYMDQMPSFAFKYMILALVLAFGEPILEKLSGPVLAVLEKGESRLDQFFGTAKTQRVLMLCLSILIFAFMGIHLSRIGNPNYWGDELFTLHLIQSPLPDITRLTAADVHPPLYYWILRVFCLLFGFKSYVYHFVSCLPYLIACILLLIQMWRKKYSILTITLLFGFISLIQSAIQYHMELRMYSWVTFFAGLAFIRLLWCIKNNQRRDYILFALFCVLSAYSHYFGLLCAALFYLVLIILCVFDKEKRANVLIASLLAILAYLPWISLFLNNLKRVSGDYWIKTVPSFTECFTYLFYGSTGLYLFFVMLAVTGIALATVKELRSWILAGYLSIFGTITLSIGMSTFIRPMLLDRYLLPISCVSWILLAFCSEKIRGKYLLSLLSMILLLTAGIPRLIDVLHYERNATAGFEKLQVIMDTEIDPETKILYTCIINDQYYYPGRHFQKIASDQISTYVCDEPGAYYLFVNPAESEVALAGFEGLPYDIQLLADDVFLSENPLEIYYIEPKS